MFSDLVSSPQRAVSTQTRNQTRSEIRDCVIQEVHELVWDRMVWPAVRSVWDQVATPVISQIASNASVTRDPHPFP